MKLYTIVSEDQKRWQGSTWNTNQRNCSSSIKLWYQFKKGYICLVCRSSGVWGPSYYLWTGIMRETKYIFKIPEVSVLVLDTQLWFWLRNTQSVSTFRLHSLNTSVFICKFISPLNCLKVMVVILTFTISVICLEYSETSKLTSLEDAFYEPRFMAVAFRRFLVMWSTKSPDSSVDGFSPTLQCTTIIVNFWAYMNILHWFRVVVYCFNGIH